jgi:hypothetical protein
VRILSDRALIVLVRTSRWKHGRFSQAAIQQRWEMRKAPHLFGELVREPRS